MDGTLGCPAWSDQAFGPRVDVNCRSFDFTIRFEDIFFACLPSAVFLCLLPSQLWALLKKPLFSSTRSWLVASKLTTLLVLFATQLAFLVVRTKSLVYTTDVSLAADTVGLLGFTGALVLSYLDHQRSARPSTLLVIYLSSVTILDVARVRTLWLISSDAGPPALMSASFSMAILALLLESIERRYSLLAEEKTGAPEQYSGFWNRTAFYWLLSTFREGYTKVLSVDSLPVLDKALKSRLLHSHLESAWSKYDRRGWHSLVRATFRAYFMSFTSAVIPRLCLSAFTFSQPFLINTTVSFIGEENPDSNYGKGLIGAWALVYLGLATSTAVYYYQVLRFATRVRGGLLGLIYHSAMKTKTSDSGEIQAITVMGTDVEQVSRSMENIHEIWASVLDIAIAIYLLEKQMSLASLAPVILILAFIAIGQSLTPGTQRAQKRWIEKIEQRLKVTSNALGDMKAVKMLGLTDIMFNIIKQLRIDEVKTSEKFRGRLIWRVFISNSPINLAPVVTFGVYAIIAVYWQNATLLTAQAFTSLSLISLLTTPVLLFIQILPAVLQCIPSFDRIQAFCNYAPYSGEAQLLESSTGSAVSLKSLPPSGTSKQPIVSFKNQTFSWEKSKPPVLRNIDVKIPSNSITVIVGPVGSGKSTFLQSIIGETYSSEPLSTSRQTSIAFCAQEPWLENDTIRSNIIGASPYDAEWYRSVIWASGLETDLELLSKGDRTLLGSKGLNLSGGQKQRVALARAVYARCPFVVLDDVFSGMDAQTTEQVSRRLLGPSGLLQKTPTTIVIATHNHKLMQFANTIITLRDGKIVETGSFESLASGNGYVAGLQINMTSDAESQDVVVDKSPDSATKAMLGRESSEFEIAMDDLSRKSGNLAVYRYYVISAGRWTAASFVACLVIWVFCSEFPSIWVNIWAEANAVAPNQNIGMYMGVFTLVSVIGTIAVGAGCFLCFMYIISNSALSLHQDLLRSVMRAPFRFFTATDTGSLTNRFSEDMQLIDMDLPIVVINYSVSAIEMAAKMILLAVYSQYMAVSFPVMGVVIAFLQNFYLRTSRQVRLLGIEAKAPLFTHFLESVSGAPTIRSFGWQSTFEDRAYGHIDTSQRPAYTQLCIQRWLEFVLNMMVAALAVVLVGVVVTWHDKFSAGSVGISLIMVMTASTTLTRLIQMWTQMESSIGAVSRIMRFVAETESEETNEDVAEAPKEWPTDGKVEFHRIVASHNPDADPVLKGISLTVEPRQHISICGRSGSGKTSLILCLLQMLNVQEGNITIDSIDVSSLAKSDLRSRINVVPQEPFLMPGTIRFNIDPFKTETDDEIIRALDRVGLWTQIKDGGGLDKEMDLSAWSAGQRQLICLARAMVRKSKVLILDEAASSVDSETEAVMQEIIDSHFKDCTVLAVMHRLKHIVRYDKVALLGDGQLLEYDSPTALLKTNSKFADLYNSLSK